MADTLTANLNPDTFSGAGNDFSDTESLYTIESSNPTGSTSINTEAVTFVYENGRRYHGYKEGKCPLPNDEIEQERLDLSHEFWLQLLGGNLYLAPISEPRRILDIGTGTGIWAIEMADVFPTTMIYGNDLSPIQPNWIPPNVRFEVDDVEDQWAFGDKKFDFIHSREMIGSIGDWPRLLDQIYENLTDGGYVELHEYDFGHVMTDATSKPILHTVKYRDLLVEAMDKFGKPMLICQTLPTMLREAGFTNVVQRRYDCPIGLWPRRSYQKKLGMLFYTMAKTGAEAYSIKLFTSVLGMDPEEARNIVWDYLGEAGNKDYHISFGATVIYARKPPRMSRAQSEPSTSTAERESKRRKKERTVEPQPEVFEVLTTVTEEPEKPAGDESLAVEKESEGNGKDSSVDKDTGKKSKESGENDSRGASPSTSS